MRPAARTLVSLCRDPGRAYCGLLLGADRSRKEDFVDEACYRSRALVGDALGQAPMADRPERHEPLLGALASHPQGALGDEVVEG
jgi:hypothetical protein